MEKPAPFTRADTAASTLRHHPPARPKGLRLAAQILLLLLITTATVGGVAYAALVHRDEETIYPRIYVNEVAVGDRTRQQAIADVRVSYGAYLTAPIRLTDGPHIWEPTPSEVGVALDIDGAVERAYQVGRDAGPVDNLRTITSLPEGGLQLAVPVTFDEAAMRRYVERLASTLNEAPIDAQLQLDGTTVRVTPSRTGRVVLVDETTQRLTAQLRSLVPGVIAIAFQPVAPRLDDTAVASVRQDIERLLANELTLSLDDQQYTWGSDTLASFLDITRVPGSTRDSLAVSVNSDRIHERLRQIADETERPGTYPRVAWNGGDLRITAPGAPGQRIDEEVARDLVLAALSSGPRAVTLPWRAIDPPVTEANLNQLGINELVSVGTSDFAGSAGYRVTNILAGMRRLNGILLAPGEEFSFTSTVGAINARNGFVEGAAIVQNRTQLEFGGGICQDSTTMFRAAFWAGLPITERWAHSFYINWYDRYGLGENGNGPGLDAAIFTGVKDLKFVNDTGAWLLIEAWADPKTARAQVDLYGTRPSREVRIEGYQVYNRIPAPGEPVYVSDPEQPLGSVRQSDRARGGMTIDLYRVVTENGVARPGELFRTRFRPWPNIFVVNPADLGPDGKPLPPPPQDPSLQPPPTSDAAGVPSTAPESDPASGAAPGPPPPVTPTPPEDTTDG
jgi:vancomycin resistance protein YoaR